MAASLPTFAVNWWKIYANKPRKARGFVEIRDDSEPGMVASTRISRVQCRIDVGSSGFYRQLAVIYLLNGIQNQFCLVPV
jgi:hypothetical protein